MLPQFCCNWPGFWGKQLQQALHPVADQVAACVQALGMYVGTILIGFAIHALISLPITLLLFTRQNPFRIMKCAVPHLRAWPA